MPPSSLGQSRCPRLVLDERQLVRRSGEGAPRARKRGARVVLPPEDHIGPDQPCPTLCVIRFRLETIRELGHRLLAYEVMGEPRREAFEKACAAYVDNYLRHMALEDSRVLPAARQHLSAADWAELDAAFAANRDPLTGHPASDEYAPLFRRIVDTAPAPVGLG